MPVTTGRRAKRRAAGVDFRQGDMADHDATDTGADSGAKRRQMHFFQLRTSTRIGRQREVRIDADRAVAGEMLGHA
jgi:hypothetical protein